MVYTISLFINTFGLHNISFCVYGFCYKHVECILLTANLPHFSCSFPFSVSELVIFPLNPEHIWEKPRATARPHNQLGRVFTTGCVLINFFLAILGDRMKQCCLGKGQIKGGITHSWIVVEQEAWKGSNLVFQAAKGNGREGSAKPHTILPGPGLN